MFKERTHIALPVTEMLPVTTGTVWVVHASVDGLTPMLVAAALIGLRGLSKKRK